MPIFKSNLTNSAFFKTLHSSSWLTPLNSSTPEKDCATFSSLGEAEDGEDKEERGEAAKEGNGQVNAGSLVGREGGDGVERLGLGLRLRLGIVY